MNKDRYKMQLTTDFRVKAAAEDDDTLIVEGWASTTTKDRGGDIVLEEAWTKGGLDNYLKNPIVLAYHNHQKPIGLVVDYSVNKKGLHVVAEINKAAGEIYNLIKSGILKAFSIGFMVKDADYDQKSDIFVIKDLEMYELSVVSIPMNADSIFSIKKSFEKEEEYKNFVKLFNKEPETEANAEVEVTKGEKIVDKDNVSLTPEQLKELEDKAIQRAFAEREAKEAEEKRIAELAVIAGKSEAEKLLTEAEKRFEEKNATISEALEGLRSELKEKAAEIEAFRKSKMEFNTGGNSIITPKEVDTAVMLAKVMGKPIDKTKYFNDLVTKAGDHLTGTNADNYETEFSTRMYDAIKDRLVMEPLFTNRVTMNSRSMVFPFNPEAGHASWVADTAYKSTDGSSTGVARTHAIQDITLKAEKLATKEYLGYEEEEDAILPILPLIQNAITRRMARTTDLELLRANSGAETVAGVTGNALINGVATLADDIGTSAELAQSSAATTTVADLQSVRRLMGVWGMMPSDVVYIVNQKTYYDLLDDPDFRTTDLVGPNATILRGQIGSVNGSPVIVSDAFDTPASGAYGAIALNAANYLFGELRGLNVERDTIIVDQKRVLVATRRFAFLQIIAGTATQSSCAVLKYNA